jgi:hypothetical protein
MTQLAKEKKRLEFYQRKRFIKNKQKLSSKLLVADGKKYAFETFGQLNPNLCDPSLTHLRGQPLLMKIDGPS